MAENREGFKPVGAVAGVFTLVLIVMVLVGGLVTSITKMRTTQARLQTSNNMKQCALAIHTFHDNFNKFPVAFGPGGQMTQNKSLWIHLLPYIESNNVYTREAAGENVVDSVFCSPYLAFGDDTLRDPMGKVSFAGNIRIFGHKTFNVEAVPADKPIELCEPGSKVVCGLRMKDVMPYTLMLATRNGTCGTAADGTPVWTTIKGDPNTPNGAFFGGSAIRSGPSRDFAKEPTMTYQLTPSAATCINLPSGVAHGFYGAALLVALADSAVRSISPSVSAQTFGRALHPNNRDPLGDDWKED